MAEDDPAKKEERGAVKKGENPAVSLEDLLVKLLATLFTRVIQKVLRVLSTDGSIRKLLGGKGSK